MTVRDLIYDLENLMNQSEDSPLMDVKISINGLEYDIDFLDIEQDGYNVFGESERVILVV